MTHNAKPTTTAPSGIDEIDSGSEEQSPRNVLKQEMEGAQTDLRGKITAAKKEIITKRTAEELKEYKSINNFFKDIFGPGFIASLLTSLTRAVSGENGEFNEEAFKEEIDEEAQKLAKENFDSKEYVVAHRALGYGEGKENSREALTEALNKQEKQIELDLRLGEDGEIYIVHDSIKGKKTEELTEFMKLNEALSIIAGSQNQDCVIVFDIKNQGILNKLDEKINEIDKQNSNNPSYKAIAERHMVCSFDAKILRDAQKRNPKRPLMFFYYPTCKYTGLQNVMNFIGINGIKSVVNKIDFFTGGKTSKELDETEIKIQGKSMSGDGKDKSFEVWNELPSEDILKLIRDSKGYLIIPGSLATKELIEKAHVQEVKIAVIQDGSDEVKEAIYDLGADLVISKTPNIIKNEPQEMDIAA